MSRDFYRRDYTIGDEERQSRPELSGNTDREQARSRPTSRSRSVSRPPVPRRMTGDWGLPKASLPSTDPRRRADTTKSLLDTAQTSTSTTAGSLKDGLPQTPAPNAFRPMQTTSSFMALDGPADSVTRADASLADTITSVLINFSDEAYSAAHARQRQEAAKKRLAAAEKADQSNRNSSKGWTTLIEQGEEDKKVALSAFEETRNHARETTKAFSTAASIAANRIVEVASHGVLAEKANRQKDEDERIARLESTVSILTSNLEEARKEIQAVKTEASTVRSTIVDPLSYTATQTWGQVESMKGDIKTLTKFQTDAKAMTTADTAEIKTLLKEFRQGYNDVKSEFGNLRAKIKNISNEQTATRKEAIRPELYAKHETLLRIEDSMNEKVKILRTGQNKLRSDVDEVRVDLQKIKNDGKARDGIKIPRSASDLSTVQDLASIKTSVDQLSARLQSMVQRPEFVRLSSMVENLSKQPNTPPVDPNTPDLRDDRQPSIMENWTNEIDRIDRSVRLTNDARQSDHKSLASQIASFRSELTNTQNTVQELREDAPIKEQLISDRFESLDSLVSNVDAELQNFREILDKKLSIEIEQRPSTSVSSHNIAAPQPTSDNWRTDFDLLKAEFRKTQEAFSKVQPDIRKAIDGNKANVHSIRALTQRYHNLTTEEMVHAMLRQLERIYPHASHVQSSFDAVSKDIKSLREELSKISSASKDGIDGLHKRLENMITTIQGHRDALKSEMSQDLKRVSDDITSMQNDISGLQKRIEDQAIAATRAPSPSSDLLAAWQKPVDYARSESSQDRPAAQRSRTDGNFAVDPIRKRKRQEQSESPDLLVTGERTGSAGLRAKVRRSEH